MKVLTLMRHGEAENGLALDDFNRRLSTTGKERLKTLNAELGRNRQTFDLVMKSPAERAAETARLVTGGLKIGREVSEEMIYEGTAETLGEILKNLSDDFENVLLIGHNPGVSILLAYLTDEINISLLPGMMAVVDLDIPNWEMLSTGVGSLREILQ